MQEQICHFIKFHTVKGPLFTLVHSMLYAVNASSQGCKRHFQQVNGTSKEACLSPFFLSWRLFEIATFSSVYICFGSGCSDGGFILIFPHWYNLEKRQGCWRWGSFLTNTYPPCLIQFLKQSVGYLWNDIYFYINYTLEQLWNLHLPETSRATCLGVGRTNAKNLSVFLVVEGMK